MAILAEVPYGERCPNKDIKKISYENCKNCEYKVSLAKTFSMCHLKEKERLSDSGNILGKLVDTTAKVNYIKITYDIFVVKNQNGFNNALYEYIGCDDGVYSKQDIRSMVTDFPKSYPAVVILDEIDDISRIYVEILYKNEVSAMFKCFEKFNRK